MPPDEDQPQEQSQDQQSKADVEKESGDPKRNRKDQLLRATRLMRQILPGDSQLGGDPLSTSGDMPSAQLARRMAEVRSNEPSLVRELGLGALQVWQAVAEAQGRGRGEIELAILFTDLVEFSSWALDAGDEAVLNLLREVGRTQESTIGDHGGKVVKRLGDGLMAVFDDAQDAVDAALEACDGVKGLDVDGYRPELRAGIHVGKPRKVGGDYLGVDVNVAARVAEAAGGNQVLVSDVACAQLEEDSFELKRLRRFKAKGAPKELSVYAVTQR